MIFAFRHKKTGETFDAETTITACYKMGVAAWPWWIANIFCPTIHMAGCDLSTPGAIPVVLLRIREKSGNVHFVYVKGRIWRVLHQIFLDDPHGCSLSNSHRYQDSTMIEACELALHKSFGSTP